MYTVFPRKPGCPEEEIYKNPLPQDFADEHVEDAVAWMEELKEEGFEPVMEWTKGETA